MLRLQNRLGPFWSKSRCAHWETETVLDMHPVHSRVTAMHVSGTSVSVGTDRGEVLAWHLGQRHDASRMGQGRRSVIPDSTLIAEARALGVARRKPTVTLPPAQYTRLHKPMSMPMLMPVSATAAQNNLHTRLAALQMRLQALEMTSDMSETEKDKALKAICTQVMEALSMGAADGTKEMLESAVQLCVRAKQLDSATEILDAARRRGIKPTEAAAASIVDALPRIDAGLSAAEIIVRVLKVSGVIPRRIYSSVIRLACEAGSIAYAEKLIEKMRRWGSFAEITTEAHRALLVATGKSAEHGRQKIRRLEEIISWMQPVEVVPEDHAVIVQACLDTGDPESAIEWSRRDPRLRRTVANALAERVIGEATALEGVKLLCEGRPHFAAPLVKALVNARKFSQAVAVLMKGFDDKIERDDIHAILKYLAKVQPNATAAIALLEKVDRYKSMADDVQAHAYVMQAMINECKTDRAIAYFERLRNKGLKLWRLAIHLQRLNESALGPKGGAPCKRASRAYEHLEIRPNMETYSALLVFAAENADARRAEDLFQDMVAARYEVSPTCLASAMRAHVDVPTLTALATFERGGTASVSALAVAAAIRCAL